SRSLIYARQEKGTLCSIHQISIEMKQNKLITECWADASSGHALSRDGQWLVYTVTNINPGDNGGIQLLNLKTLTKKTLVTYQPTDFGDYDFSWSPDNSLIAMTRINTPSTREIVTLSLDGAIEQITRDSAIIAGHTWSADGQSIVYSSKKGGAPRLWQANIADHSSTLLGLSVAASHPYMTQDGKTLLYQKNFQVIDIQQIVLNNPVDGTVSTNSTSTINNVISSTGIDTAPDYSDMTEQLVFSSNRSGYQEIWLANFDGSNPVQLSQFESTAYHPKWSPDGKKIAFTVSDASQSKQQQVFILNLLTRQYSQITYEPVDHLYPEWSADGESIYTSMRTANRWNIWQYPLSKEAPRQITHAGGLISYPAPTGDGIYFSKNESDGIWYQPDNSDEQWVFSTANKDIHNKWVIDANGIFYVTTRDKHQQLEYYDFATKTIAVKTKLKKSAIIQSSLTYNAKLSTFYYSHSGRKESDIIMTSVAQ
ncbi:MAG: Tol biopolymer transport system component, partial [Phenylobacterium sp.]